MFWSNAMKEVKVLGPGCQRCQTTEQMVRDAAQKLGVDINLEKISDYAEMARYGVLSTPGIVIDGKVVHAGGLPKAESLEEWLRA